MYIYTRMYLHTHTHARTYVRIFLCIMYNIYKRYPSVVVRAHTRRRSRKDAGRPVSRRYANGTRSVRSGTPDHSHTTAIRVRYVPLLPIRRGIISQSFSAYTYRTGIHSRSRVRRRGQRGYSDFERYTTV